jgi:hypothetical protein
MKKQLLALISLMFLAGCSLSAQSKVNVTVEEKKDNFSVTYAYGTRLPTVHTRLGSGSHITYLMMSPYGQIEINGEKVQGGDYEPKFYENCIIWESEPGGALPEASKVSSTLYGVTFRGWYQYNDNIYPDKLETVPATNGSQVFAIFDGPSGGAGNQGGGGSSQGGGGSSQGGGGGAVVTTGYGFYFEDGRTVQATYNGEQYGKVEYVAHSVSFTEGNVFSLYDFSNGAKWVVNPNPYSFGGTEQAPVYSNYIAVGATSYTAKQTFTADVYIQLLYENDTIYFGLV